MTYPEARTRIHASSPSSTSTIAPLLFFFIPSTSLLHMTTQAVNIKGTGTTYASAASASSANRLAGLVPAPSVTLGNDDHRRNLKRWFLGPMPEKIVTDEVKKRKLDWRDKIHIDRKKPPPRPLSPTSSTSSSDSDDSLGPPVDRERLFHLFIKRGGHAEDWDADAERSIRKEVKKRWKESGWYNVWRGEKHKRQAGEDRKWVGTSFVIGSVLGVEDNLILGAASVAAPGSTRPGAESSRAATPSLATRPSSSLPAPDGVFSDPGPSGLHDSDGSSPANTADTDFTTAHPNTSTTGLLHTDAFRDRPDIGDRPVSDIIVRPSSLSAGRQPTAFTTGSDGHDPIAPSSGLRSALKSISDRKGKRKSVNFDPGSPAPPQEVLARTGASVKDTSAGAAREDEPAPPSPPSKPAQPTNRNDIIMKGGRYLSLVIWFLPDSHASADRMLVKVSYNRSEGLPHPYDEKEAGRHPDSVEEEWAEFLVCWRGSRLELYEDWVSFLCTSAFFASDHGSS